MNLSEMHPILYDQLKQSVLPIIAVAGDARMNPVGSAFVIAVPEPKTALVLTAAHVINFVHDIESRGQYHHPTITTEFRPKPQSYINLDRTMVYVGVRGNSGMVLAEMIQSWHTTVSDVALMLVKIRDDDDVSFNYRLSLDTRPVEENTLVLAVGYSPMLSDFMYPPNYEVQDFRVQLQIQLQTRRGKVTRVCSQGLHNNRWPGFIVDTAFDSGMSGGPLIDLSGDDTCVRGLVGSDISETQEDGYRGSGGQAFASMLWPAMLLEVPIEFGSKDGRVVVPKNSCLFELVRHGLINDRGECYKYVGFQHTESTYNCWWHSNND